mgnify:CR=1 FL=1
MADTKSFPLHFPELTRVNNLDGADTAVEDLKIYISQYLPLIILGTFPNAKDLLTNANMLCTQAGAPPTQRVLWIKDVAIRAAIQPVIDAAIAAGFPDKEYSHDNIRALSMASGKAAYLIFVDPALSPEPKDKRKSLSTFQMQRAFNAAIALIPATTPGT